MTLLRAEKQIQQAINEGRLTLAESESKKLLSYFGVPVAPFAVVRTAAEALSRASKTGFPVVLKGHGPTLTHKTERQLVRVNIRSQAELRRAFADITRAAGKEGDGCLLQPFIEGRREFVAGLFRDPQFGAVIMFGLGGIFTEALADTAFRIAPVSKSQALRMIEEISSQSLLGAFRGEAPADRESLAGVVMSLSDLALAHPEVKEVDINPLIVSPKGKVKAVDADRKSVV